MAATMIAKRLIERRAEGGGQAPRPRHRIRNTIAAVAIGTAGWQVASKTDVGRGIEQGIEHGIESGVKDFFGAFGIHLHWFSDKSAPPHAVASVDHQAATYENLTLAIGGKVSTYTGVYAEHGHHTGGETYKKLIPTDALIGGDAGQVTSEAKLIWDDNTTTYANSKGKIVGNKTLKTLKMIEVDLPGPEIISPRIEFDTPAMYANLRPGDSPQTIAKKIADYENKAAYAKAHNGKGAPKPDYGISYHKSAYCLDLCGTIDNQDGGVVQVGDTAAQVAMALDAYNPNDQRVQSLIQNTDSQIYDYAVGMFGKEYPGVPVVAVYPDNQSYIQTIEQRYQSEAQSLGLLAASAYFDVSSNKAQDLEFQLKMTGGPHAIVTFDQPTSQPEVDQLNQLLGLTEPPH